MRFHILTIFPNIFRSYLSESLLKRALARGIIKISVHNIRDWSSERHKKVDDRPFGGGPGMVLQVGPIYRAVQKLRRATQKKKIRVVLFSTRGKKLNAKTAQRLSRYDELTLICGRYEGVDERVAKRIADEEISIGDYVLSGGELPALVLMEAVSRYLPGFLGKQGSLEELKGSYPAYSRPEVFSPKRGVRWAVPKVLLGGNHVKIRAWRRRMRSS